MKTGVFISEASKLKFYNELLAPCTSQVPFYLIGGATRRKFNVIFTKEAESELNIRAPFNDKNGHELWSDDVVVNDHGQQMVLRHGPYKSFDDEVSAEGWGWYLQVGVVNDDGLLIFYQVLPVTRDTPAFISYVNSFAVSPPDWYHAYEKQAEQWRNAQDKFIAARRGHKCRYELFTAEQLNNMGEMLDIAGDDLCRVCREHAHEWGKEIDLCDKPRCDMELCPIALNYWLEEVVK